MKQLPNQLRKPDLILVISAHWEEPEATLLGSPNPEMFYDYYGFPDEAYEIDYPAPGSSADANRFAELLKKNHIAAKVDPQRGLIMVCLFPLKLMYPQADIPALQLSLIRGLNSSAHIGLGKALRELNQENILVIGSGFHSINIRTFSHKDNEPVDPANDAFKIG